MKLCPVCEEREEAPDELHKEVEMVIIEQHEDDYSYNRGHYQTISAILECPVCEYVEDYYGN